MRGRDPGRQAAIQRLYEAAASRTALADESTDRRSAPAAVSLYRESIYFLANALLISENLRPPGPPLELDAALAELEQRARAEALPPLPARYAEARALLETPADPTREQPGALAAARGRAAVESVVAWLCRQIEPRDMRQIWMARARRFALAAVVLLLALRAGWNAVEDAKNVALHRPVTLSERYPGTPDPAGATDGKIVGPFQAHTTIAADPWITIDLQKVHQIGRVAIYNRSDGLEADALPLTLELSKNNIDFEVVDRRTTAFTSYTPWVFTSRTAAGRFVRVHGHRNGYVVVSEIKVFDR